MQNDGPNHFNPRTRMGCDTNIHITSQSLPLISIHAPAWGATHLIFMRKIQFLFQSTHPHGVRLFKFVMHSTFHLFQSTHPHGVRPEISIRALLSSLIFQSTHPHGVRPHIAQPTSLLPSFQSTHPHGVRPNVYRQQHRHRYFNPRTRMGCDFSTRHPIHIYTNFNPRTLSLIHI